MPLQLTPAYELDAAGAAETISLYSSAALIASAFYGVDASKKPLPVTVAPDRRSLTLSVVAGLNFLTVTLFSPATKSETATLYQGDPVDGALADIQVNDHSGIGSILIQGS